MRYRFLVETYGTEVLKVLSVWSMFEDFDLSARPAEGDRRARSVLEHMVHQSMSENLWWCPLFPPFELGVDGLSAAP